MRHKVDVDIPGPVANHHHQAQDEEEYEEVRGLGVGAIQQTQHGHQQDDAQADVKISKMQCLLIHAVDMQRWLNRITSSRL